MRYGLIFLVFVSAAGTLSASKPAVDFSGMFSTLGRITAFENDAVYASARYLPLLDLNFSPRFDAELSADAATFFRADNPGGAVDNLDLDPYRAWIRLRTPRFEARLGLQKINFGPARILRSLMWFDQLDPKDPLQFTRGVYGLRLRYDFTNNAGAWFWGLYGNDDLKGWESCATEEKTPEAGCRFVFPIGNAEAALSTHHRSVQPDGLAENRIALDGYWDAGAGLWFESVLVHTDFSGVESDYRSFLTLGSDYTFPLGNGLTATVEHLRISTGDGPLDDGERTRISCVSLSCPVGFMDMVSFFSYFTWETDSFFQFFNWQRSYDRWMIHLSCYFLSDDGSVSPAAGGAGGLGNRGVQLTVSFNH